MAAQFTFIKGKEYKVVNWIDGNVYITTFSAAGKESTVRSAVTIAKVMAALVEQAHAEALEADRIWNARNANTKAERLAAETGFTVAQCAAELEAEEDDYFAARDRLRFYVTEAHAEALEVEAERKEARRVAEVVRAEFYLHNPVFQRDFIAAAHDEALAMNKPDLRRADELYAGCRIRTRDGVKTIAAVEADSDNTMLIYLKGEEDNPREAYKHTEIEVIN